MSPELAGLAPSNPHARDCARLVCLDSLASLSLSFLAIVKGSFLALSDHSLRLAELFNKPI